MSVDYSLAVRNARLTAVLSAIDAGAGHGVLRLLNSVGGVLSSIALAKPSGSASGGVLRFLRLSLIDPAAAASGTAVGARIEDSTGATVIADLTVGTGGTDIVLSPTNAIVAGQTVAITAATITGN